MQLRRKHAVTCTKQEPCVNVDGQIPLTSLREGAKAVITHTTGDINVVRRLSEMGLTPGCKLKLSRKCSFKGPIEVEVRGVALALGYTLASEICVQPTEGNDNGK
jgi:Fe2+ transport system protein FeoA